MARHFPYQVIEVRKDRRNSWLLVSALTAAVLLVTAFALIRLQVISLPGTASKYLPSLPNITKGASQAASFPDNQAPAAPRNLSVIPTGTKSISLTWSASSDNVGISGYTVYRDGVSIATVQAGDLAYIDSAGAPNTTYSYALDAFDQAGNHSAVSAAIQVITPALPGSLTFLLPTADTFVNAGSPRTIYGTSPTLRVDEAPDVHAYLRFIIPPLAGKKVYRARLMLYANTGTSMGIRAMAVTDNNWSEETTDYTNAPAIGSQLAQAAGVESASWIILDVSGYISGEGSFTIGILGDSRTAVSVASRESGANSPQLVLDLH